MTPSTRFMLLLFENAAPKTRPNNSKHSSDTYTGKFMQVCVQLHFPPQCCITVAKYSANLLSVTAQWVRKVCVSVKLTIIYELEIQEVMLLLKTNSENGKNKFQTHDSVVPG